MSTADVKESLDRLLRYCEMENWKGFDPYDGLNTPCASVLSPAGKIGRILLIQFFKRSPINLRSLFLIRKDYNPKALGLFLSAVVKLYGLSGDERHKRLSYRFIDHLVKHKSRDCYGACWGYNFDWQSRSFFLPKFTPTVVTTSFVANAFLDAYQVFGEERFLEVARSSCGFMLNNLNRVYRKEALCFSYSPLDRSIIHNANILGARLLSRVARVTGEEKLKGFASDSIDFVVRHQNPDGSWYYGEDSHQRWIDNFHTGFVLDCLYDCIDLIPRFDLLPNLEKGLKFYADNLFLPDGTSKYYYDRVFPIDIHSCAQSIITLTKFSSSGDRIKQLKDKVVTWTLNNMQDSDGYFYFQKRRLFTNRIAYMRWSQAWMLKALTSVLAAEAKETTKSSLVGKTNVVAT
ncbi:MAG: delta-aminolevulinic acid dehydratase [Candidatus Zixiibacteriota bacterium]|nr:MAG: delta-aminolevulinic acid dehydratase [candidate division Zixibacteria bacterium]